MAGSQIRIKRGAARQTLRPGINDRRQVCAGDFILGINRVAGGESLRFIPYYGYGAGVVRIVIGDNWESGEIARAMARLRFSSSTQLSSERAGPVRTAS